MTEAQKQRKARNKRKQRERDNAALLAKGFTRATLIRAVIDSDVDGDSLRDFLIGKFKL